MSFITDFRPESVNELVGVAQRKIAGALIKAVSSGEINQRVLFIGGSGTGKTTIAKIYANTILKAGMNDDDPFNENIAFTTVNCTADTGIDYIRENVIRGLHYMPMPPYTHKIFFLDELHGLSKSAQNALLKDLENLPPHVIILGATTDPQKIIKTLKDRFSVYTIKSPSNIELKKRVKQLSELVSKSVPDDVVDDIVFSATGSVRVVDSLVEQYLNGSYSPVESDANNKKSLLYTMFFNRNSTLQDWFVATDNTSGLQGETVRLCSYSIKGIRLGKPRLSDHVETMAHAVLKCFGGGLSNRTSEKVSFHSKLLDVWNEVNGDD